MDSKHTHTPTLSAVDPRGLVVRIAAYERRANELPISRVTRQVYSPAGRLTQQIDPRLLALAQAGETVPPNQSISAYSLSGNALATFGVDEGWHVNLSGEAGQPLSLWDSNGSHHRIEYDALMRPSRAFEQSRDAHERCRERLVYAGNSIEDSHFNRCAQLIRHDDDCGSVFVPAYNLSGLALEQTRQFLAQLQPPAWPVGELEGTQYRTAWRYDALNAALSLTDATGNVQNTRYDIAGLPAQAWLVRPDRTVHFVVSNVTYDAYENIRSQTLGNGVTRAHQYDAANGWLTAMSAHRADGSLLQDLHYAYDAVGNVSQADDTALPTRHFRNQRTTSVNTYEYDSLYQLIAATGREVANPNLGPALPGQLRAPVDPRQLTHYRETYSYDAAGNLQTVAHMGSQPWCQRYTTARHSNRSLPEVNGELPGEADITKAFDPNGNLRRLQTGQALGWDLRNQLQQVDLVRRDESSDDSEHYRYDAASQRARKVTVRQTARVEHVTDVRYLPGLEIHKNNVAGGATLHVISAHVGSIHLRVLNWVQGLPRNVPSSQARYSLADRLGSVTLELDTHAVVLTQEGFYPYGGSAWWSSRDPTEASYKSIRYSGKERDVTGLYYYGARYYAPWLHRWINPDPVPGADGLNRYQFVRNNPLTRVDPDGQDSTIPKNAHWVWMGGPLPRDFARNVNKFADKNRDYTATLWVDRRTGSAKHLAALENIGPSINVRLIDEAFEGVNPRLLTAYERERSGSLHNYAAASDIARAVILYQFGGIYMDADVEVRLKMPLGQLSSPSGILKLRAKNAVIAASKGNAYVSEALNRIASTYSVVNDTPWSIKRAYNNREEYVLLESQADSLRRVKNKTDEQEDAIDNLFIKKAALRDLALDNKWGDPHFPGTSSRLHDTVEMTGPNLWGAVLSKVLGTEMPEVYFEKIDASAVSYVRKPSNLRRDSI